MQVHAANKPIDRGNSDAVLQKVAELAVGYSGAELANLLNEAAILAVRANLSSHVHPSLACSCCLPCCCGDLCLKLFALPPCRLLQVTQCCTGKSKSSLPEGLGFGVSAFGVRV